MGVDPRRPAFLVIAATREPVLDRRARGDQKLILSSAFSAIVVYAQELVPGRVGLISGVFFGFAFGMGASAPRCCQLADRIGIERVYGLCAFLPAIGLLAVFLPNVERVRSGS